MTRYVAIRPRAEEIKPAHYDDPPSYTSGVVWDAEGPQPTGLLDANGVPLYRVPERVKFGFVR